MNSSVLSYLKEHILLLDGGMGTLLQAAGLLPGELPERWNLTHAELITELHRRYYDAGSNLVLANTFGANRLKYDSAELEQIVCAAMQNARAAAEQSCGSQPKWVALDIGPSGKMLAPLGDLDFEDAVRMYAETVRLGVRYGADAIVIETVNDCYEAKAALLAAKENSTLPVFVTCAFGTDGRLMTGADPETMVAMLEGLGADAVGVNCSFGPELLAPVAERMLKCASVPVICKPNAGLPRTDGAGHTVYDLGPTAFAAQVAAIAEMGVHAVGGCCGTTPAHIEALHGALRNISPMPITEQDISCVSSYTHCVTFGQKPVLIGERINPTGKKRFQAALREGDGGYALREGLQQEEAGAHVLDVNVGLPGIDEEAVLVRTVQELQAVCSLPLQIDTADPAAMEAAARRYNGKPMLNSVNGKRESLAAVLPIVKKYGGVVVALTLDEGGIPETAEGRVAIARKILAEAEQRGIAKKNLIFDPLAMTISADHRAAIETLTAVRRIREELGCRTMLGVSNVSFGLPARELVNGAFFSMALDRGLSAAILNPYSEEMQKAYHTYRVLSGLDSGCEEYMKYASTLPSASPVAPSARGTEQAVGQTQGASASQETLADVIGRGLRSRAGEMTAELLSNGADPMSLVEREIIPALNAVGEGFEKKTIYLPQLLMSAEAASEAFDRIKAAMPAEKQSENAARFVLATVKGDIHDIGKNIVRLLLENYGFAVTDLGKDVPPEQVVEAVERLHAPLCGLSALMTTTVPAMAETVALLHQRTPWCRVIVGGAVLNAEYAASIGADCYAADAMETVRSAKAYLEREENA